MSGSYSGRIWASSMQTVDVAVLLKQGLQKSIIVFLCACLYVYVRVCVMEARHTHTCTHTHTHRRSVAKGGIQQAPLTPHARPSDGTASNNKASHQKAGGNDATTYRVARRRIEPAAGHILEARKTLQVLKHARRCRGWVLKHARHCKGWVLKHARHCRGWVLKHARHAWDGSSRRVMLQCLACFENVPCCGLQYVCELHGRWLSRCRLPFGVVFCCLTLSHQTGGHGVSGAPVCLAPCDTLLPLQKYNYRIL